jgi:hypothetical protein
LSLSAQNRWDSSLPMVAQNDMLSLILGTPSPWECAHIL